MVGPTGRVLMAETAIQFLERWRQAHVYAELRALEQLDETVAECIGAAAQDGNFRRAFRKGGRWQSQRIPSRGNYQYERIMPDILNARSAPPM